MSNSNALLSNPLALYDILQKAYTEMFFPNLFFFFYSLLSLQCFNTQLIRAFAN